MAGPPFGSHGTIASVRGGPLWADLNEKGLMELSEKKRSEYLDLRHRYEPRSVKLVVIAESPPASGLYFYDPTGAPSEPLFAALMKQLRLSPTTKEEGLRVTRCFVRILQL